MSIQNGNNLLVTADTEVVGFSQSCSISFAQEVIQQSYKGLAGFTAGRIGRKTVTVSTNGLYDPTDTGQSAVLTALFDNSETVTLSWGIATGAGTENYSGDFIITSVELNGDENADGTYTVSFQNSGTVTRNYTAPA